MQQKQKEQYEDALGSIFDFIFEESKKPPSKVKPAKITGVDGTTEIVDALSDVLTSPLLFVNDEVRGAFNDSFDADILPLKVGERGGADTLTFSLSDMKDIIRDPGSWVDKQFSTLDQTRKMQRAAWAGEEVKGILGALWARERDLDFETQMAMAGAGRQGNRTTGADSEYMVSRSNDLASKHFGGLTGSVGQADFIKKYGRERGQRMYKVYKKWSKAKEEGKDPALNSEIYYILESQELKEKSDTARQSGDMEKAEQYSRASKYTATIPYQQKVRAEIQKQKDQLKESAKYIKQLKKSSLKDKDQKIKELRTSMKEIESNLGQLRLNRAAGTLGRIEGGYHSAKNLFLDGNLIPAIINGKFFDANRNQIRWLQPSQISDISHKKGRKAVGFHAAKEGEGPLSSTYYTAMNAVYYMSPVTWARSLTNGEIFAYVGHVRREFFKRSEFVKGLSGFDLDKFMEKLEEGDESYLESLAGSLTEEQLKKLERFVKWDEAFGNLAYVFNTTERVKNAIKEFVQKEIMKKLRKKVEKALLKVIKDKVASELIKSWAITGGIKVLIKGLVTAAASAIGLSGTPIASAIIGAVTWVLSEIVYQVGKVTIKLGLMVSRAVFFGFIAIFLLIGSMMVAFAGIFGKHSHVAPHEVVMCDAYEPLDPIDFPDIPGGGGEDIDFECGPGETVQGLFNRMASEMGLSGAELVLVSPGDEMYERMYDSTWCIAGYNVVHCKSDKITSCNDVIVRLFKHELVHLRQYRNGGGRKSPYGILFLEWGAEWISENGGGYAFSTEDGSCIRATATPTLSGCTKEAYRGIAYNEASYLNSQCFLSLKKYITGFCGSP